MVSQLTYVATVIDIPDDTIKDIQGQIDDCVLGIKPGGRKWMNQQTLKISWIRRYVIDKLDNHWADLVDIHLGIDIDKRDKILDYGPEKFNSIIKAKLPGISSIFNAYKKVKTLFPTEPETMDNSWILQNIFNNTNFNRKNPDNNTTVHLTPGFMEYRIGSTP